MLVVVLALLVLACQAKEVVFGGAENATSATAPKEFVVWTSSDTEGADLPSELEHVRRVFAKHVHMVRSSLADCAELMEQHGGLVKDCREANPADK